ncbi:MAG: hypothetical protein AAGU74_01310 [Bacillota bacterium]
MYKTIATIDSYNQRRYSSPWVARIIDGKYDFKAANSSFTGDTRTGAGGELLLINPVTDGIYAYGQKDHRGNGTYVIFTRFDGEGFATIEKTEAMKASFER